jgi:hypothetical protein
MRGLGLAATAAALTVGYRLLVTGKLTIDTGWGRTVRVLGPFSIDVAAPPDIVFDVIAGPYLLPTPRAMAGKLEVVERGSDLAVWVSNASTREELLPDVEPRRPHDPNMLWLLLRETEYRDTLLVLAAQRTPVRRRLGDHDGDCSFRATAPGGLPAGAWPSSTRRGAFLLHRRDHGTTLEYSGELGGDLWAAGRWWG